MNIKICKIRHLALYGVVGSISINQWIDVGSPFLGITFLFVYVYTAASMVEPGHIFQRNDLWRRIILLISVVGLILAMTFVHKGRISDYTGSIIRLLSFYSVVFVLVASDFRRYPELRERSLKVFLGGVLVLAGIFVLHMGSYMGGRVRVGGLNPNYMGQLVTLALLVIGDLVYRKRVSKRGKQLLIAATPLLLLMLARSGSRGAMIAFVLGGAIYVLLVRDGGGKRISRIIFGLVMLSLMVASLGQSELVHERFFEDEDLSGYRYVIWDAALDIVQEYPIFGVGAAKYEAEIARYLGRYRPAHNEFLSILLFSGVAGLGLFLWFLASLHRASRRTLRFTGDAFPYVALITTAFFLFKAGGGLLKPITWIMFAYVATADQQLKMRWVEVRASFSNRFTLRGSHA